MGPRLLCSPAHGTGKLRTVSISKSRMYSFLQLGHRSAKQLPCSSASLFRGTPERRCSPSTFWLTTRLTLPRLTSSAMACQTHARSDAPCMGDMRSIAVCLTAVCGVSGCIKAWPLKLLIVQV